ncbi:radical SAM protein [Methanocalculus chunghsingensis]|nr:radical SAM protein [Methanocalculus chunghsingensis]
MTLEEKAFLLSIGSIELDERLFSHITSTQATAGPGAGGISVFIRSGEHRVRLAVKDHSPLQLLPEEDGVVILYHNEPFVYGFLETPLCHCPEQAYITVSERCIFHCRFCPVPKLHGGRKSIETIIGLVQEASATGGLKAISLTSGVAISPEEEVEWIVEVVHALHSRFDLPIGVSVYPTKDSSRLLYDAGAVEIKYNVETMDPVIFATVCPDFSLSEILDALREAVRIFGKNAVFSNFIIGLGEDDQTVLDGVTTLARMGVIPNLRPISPSPLREGEITIQRPSQERLLYLAKKTVEILVRYGLDARSARTMCFPCTGCDITPFRDIY